jgi:hypothetical protein
MKIPYLFIFFQCLYTQSFYEYFKTLEKESQSYSVDGQNFKVCFVPYSKKKENKNYPMISIETDNEIIGYIQIVRTDSTEFSLKEFIDAGPSIFPYYTEEKFFFDAPIWNFSLFQKPIYYWDAHLYAVLKNKEVIPLTKWGFHFKYFFSLSPSVDKPCNLAKSDIEADKKLLADLLL